MKKLKNVEDTNKKWLEITLKAIKNNTDSENAGTIKKLRYLNSPGFNF